MKYSPSGFGETSHHKDYSKTIIFSTKDFAEKGHLLQTVTIPANTKQRLHSHNKQTEIFYILEGECSIFISGKEYLSKPGDAFVCSPGDKHYLWNKTNWEE